LTFADEIYRHIVEAVPEGIWVVTHDGKTIFSNRRMAELLGVDFESMSEQSCFACVYPEELADARNHFARTFEGDRRPFDFRLRRADGSPIWVSISCMPVFDGAGAQVGLLGLFSDISERKRTEAALRESEERFRNMADTAPVMIWVTDAEGMFTFFNKTWLEFTGRTIEQELGTGWTANVHPDDLQNCYEMFRASFDSRRKFQIESRLRRFDGQYRSVLCSGIPRFAPEGDFVGYIGSDIDITDLQGEQRFRQLAENIDQVFWMLDLETRRVLYVSPVFEKVWGCSPAPLYVNRDWLIDTVHPEDRDRVTAFFIALGSRPAEESYRIVRPDGAVRWILDRAFVVLGPEGKPYRLAGIASDITEQRRLEDELRQAQKMEAIGRLAGGIAHDFNNLLTVITGYSQMLIDGTQAGDPGLPRLEQILNAANRAAVLTEQLLAFSRARRPGPKVVNINHLLLNMESLLRPLVGERVAIETALDPQLGRIKVDPHQIEQIVMNLATNARDAMPHGGRLMIETRMADLPDARSANGPDAHAKHVLLRIGDTGCGMDSYTRERAFEPFFTTKGPGKGTGLGLSTVYGIVTQNQGEIHLSSELGRGTIFDLYFPQESGTEIRNEVPPPGQDRRRSPATILIVEDEPAVRGLV